MASGVPALPMVTTRLLDTARNNYNLLWQTHLCCPNILQPVVFSHYDAKAGFKHGAREHGDQVERRNAKTYECWDPWYCLAGPYNESASFNAASTSHLAAAQPPKRQVKIQTTSSSRSDQGISCCVTALQDPNHSMQNDPTWMHDIGNAHHEYVTS